MTMPRADIKLNANSAAWASVTHVRAYGGIGIARLGLDIEVTPRSEAVVGGLIAMMANVRVILPNLQDYLCQVLPVRQYVEIPMLGGSVCIAMEAPLGMRQLKIIEAYRTADVTLRVEFTGHWVIGEQHVPFWNGELDFEIEQSKWLKHLAGWGYRNVLLLEFEHPHQAPSKQLAQAFIFLSEARDHFLKHDARQAVESLRQCLASIAGEDHSSEEGAAEIAGDLRQAGKEGRAAGSPVPYSRRFDLVRRSLKFTTDVAAHPDADDTTLVEAESLLIMTAGLLHRVGRAK